jgi:hypothetical protein
VVGLTQVGFAMVLDIVLWHRSLSLITGLGFVLLLAPSAWLSIRAARAVMALQRLSEKRTHVPVAASIDEVEVAQSIAAPPA